MNANHLKIVNPKKWKKPVGYSNAIRVEGPTRTLYLGGQVAFDEKLRVVGKGDIVKQFEQVMTNIVTVLEEAGATTKDIVKLVIFVQDRDDYKLHAKEIGVSYRWHFGDHYPAMTLVEVARFFEEDVLLEIEAIAEIPIHEAGGA